MQILRPLHQLVAGGRRVRFWSARWLSPRFVWPEARHEMRPRCRYRSGTVKVWFLPTAPADMAAPTAAEISLGIDLSQFVASVKIPDPPLVRRTPPPGLRGGIVTSDLRRWPEPGFVTGRGDLDDIEGPAS